jgi:hypothetical protein
MEAETRRLALRFEVIEPGLAVVDASKRARPYDKTLLLMIGQERAPMSAVIDGDSVTFAARFDSGYNFLELFQISGGMPTRLSIQRSKLAPALTALGVPAQEIRRLTAPP